MVSDLKVSVVMCVYNGERYLKEAIESILNQSYSNFEFIIVDDGSMDKSLEIISRYSKIDNRIITISRRNKGLVKSLNDAIKISRGKYIVRMDSDDISHKNRIKEQIEFLENNNHIDILGCCVNIIGDVDKEEKEEISERFNIELQQENTRDVFIEECCIAHSSVIMKKNIFDTLKCYDESFLHGEDYELWLRAIKSGFNISKINKVLHTVRCHTKSKTRTIDNKDYFIFKDHMRAKFNYIDDIIKNKKKCIIWGASNGGNLVFNYIKSNYSDIEVCGFMDKYKTGENQNIKIFKPEEIKEINFEYVFIATTPGKYEAKKLLEKNKLKIINDFIIIN